jgi:hypothetical protein
MLDLLQWPAMLASVLAAWLVASNSPHKRNIGFWVFLFSNVLWVAWGWPQRAYALVLLQVVLALMNVRGLKKTEALQEKSDTGSTPRPMHGGR